MKLAAVKCLAALALGAAVYGGSIGAVHSWLFAARNLIKFPLLILGTAALCAPAYALVARFLAARLSFVEALGLVLRLFRDACLLLAALAPACLFLARTLEPPGRDGLGEYPLFLGFNVALIAICGSLALVRRGRVLLHERALSRWRVTLLLGCWLLLSLLVGGQWAWYLRPFFGVASIGAEVTPFCLGTLPDFRGATSFYEAVLHLADPPPLPEGFYLRAWGR
jgi:hypothetical protein